MLTTNKDFGAFANEYKTEEKEILVLTSDQSGGAGKLLDSWDASQYFLAYVDLKTNELKKGDGRINWLITDEQCKQYGPSWPYNFKNGAIYQLKVRELTDNTVPENGLPSFYNRFMIVEVLKENVVNDQLNAVLAEYRTPVEFTDEKLGKFELNKDYGFLRGKLKWIEKEISVSLDVDINNKESWGEAMKVLHILSDQQGQRDLDFRTYAGEQLAGLANDWLEDENTEFTKNDFIQRISLSELVVTSDGDYTAYYDDDDIFYGHIIDISGNIKTGITSASIAG